MANEIQNLQANLATTEDKLNNLAVRVSALATGSGINPADVQAAADRVAALGQRIDAIASAA